MKLKVGGDIDAFCSRCDLDLAHTVVAIHNGKPVQTKCNTCGAFHKYRRAKAADSGVRPRVARTRGDGRDGASRPKRETSSLGWKRQWDAQMREVDNRAIAIYRPSASFDKESVLQHPRFGVGVVQQILTPQKMSVLFRDGPRTLLMNR